jgi:predicted nucleotidyltransferase
LELNRFGSGIDPVFDANVYNYLVGDVLEARTIETADIVVRYTITAPRGRIRVEVPEPGG